MKISLILLTLLSINENVMAMKIIDLTHTISKNVPTWSGKQGFDEQIHLTCKDGFCVKSYTMSASLGTHMDAPSHVIERAQTIDELKPEMLVAPGCVIDVSDKVQNNADYAVSVEDILGFEEKYGKIPENSIVFALTGWDQYWDNSAQYRNVDKNGIMHFPGFSADTAQLLIERNVAGIGIDTFSPDPGALGSFPVHQIMLSAGKFIIENLTNLKSLPATGSQIIALPLKIKDGAESPARVIAIISFYPRTKDL